MRIVYLKLAYSLEEDSGSERDYYICKKMIENGHHVSVVTSNINYKTSLPKYPDRGVRTIFRNHNGIDIYYVYTLSGFQSNLLKRLIYYFTYCLFALIAIRHIKKADAIYAVSVPLPVGIVGYIYSKFFKAEFYFELTDIWPDVLIEMGFLKNRHIIGLLRRMELFCYRKAKKIITLGQLARLRIVKRVDDSNKIIVITNGIDSRLFPEEINGELIDAIKEKYFLKGKMVCMYMGAFGRYNALETIVNAAARLVHNDEIRFVLIGAGDEKKKLGLIVEHQNLHNTIFIQPVPRSESPAYLQMADIFILPNLRGRYYEMNLQNKLFDYLASSKPIVFAGSGESADIILESKSGKVVEAEDDLAVASAIEEIKALAASERIQMGKNGRKVALDNFERAKLAQRLLQIIEHP